MAEKKAEKKPAKKEAKKTTKKVEWNEGYPEEKGLFHCRQGKDETVLRHLHCEMTGKHQWATVAGTIPCGEAIEWEGKPMTFEEIQKFVG